MADRLNSYKNRGKKDEYMKRMKDQAVELRKAKKDEQLSKRRNLVEHGNLGDSDEESSSGVEQRVHESMPDMNELRQALFSDDLDTVVQATRVSRKILSKEVNPPIDIFIEANLIPRFVELLSANSAELQFESAWVLTNVASGSEAQTLPAVEAGACQMFLKLLEVASPNVVEQVLWGLSNIAGTGPNFRDLLLQSGLVTALVKLVNSSDSRSLLATAAWCLSNLCRKMSSLPDFDALLPAIPVLRNFLDCDSVPVVSDACWALSYFTDGPNERIEVVCRANVISRVVGLLGNTSDRAILIPALRVIGNIVTGDDAQTQRVIDGGALSALKTLLNSPTAATKKEVIWALSNILAGNARQIEAVINEGLLPPLVDMLTQGEYKCRVEATWAICNYTCGASPKQINLLLQHEALAPLTSMLDCRDPRLIRVVLDAFGNVLRIAKLQESLPEILEHLEEVGFVDRCELLQMHEEVEIYKRATNLLEIYWNVDGDEDEDEEPATGDKEKLGSDASSGMSFGALQNISKFTL